MRLLLSQYREMPFRDRMLVCFSVMVLLWQGVYLSVFFGDAIYHLIETPVAPPAQCSVVSNEPVDLDDLGPGQVHFRLDMRCTSLEIDTVYVTSPWCSNCGPEGWNELEDADADGIYERVLTFTDPLSEEPLVGIGIPFRYAVRTPQSYGGGEEVLMSYPENLVEDSVAGHGCAPVGDGITYAYRTLDTDSDGVRYEHVFGSCDSVPIAQEAWLSIREDAWEEANPFLAEKVDPWYLPIRQMMRRAMFIDPILFLTFCTLLYVYGIITIGTSFARRKEALIQAALDEANHKNTYLEHAARMLRHDMHSGINTYIPRGIGSLERRLDKDPECAKRLKLEMPMRLLKEGLTHTQRVYRGVTEFTNLVRPGVKIDTSPHDLNDILREFLESTIYRSQVLIEPLPTVEVNAPLFCTAIDNLIRNGLKYNDSDNRMVQIKMIDNHHLGIIDNGRGMTQADFDHYSQPFTRKEGQKETGTGLGLNICKAILHEHGFPIVCTKRAEGGTVLRIKIL